MVIKNPFRVGHGMGDGGRKYNDRLGDCRGHGTRKLDPLNQVLFSHPSTAIAYISLPPPLLSLLNSLRKFSRHSAFLIHFFPFLKSFSRAWSRHKSKQPGVRREIPRNGVRREEKRKDGSAALTSRGRRREKGRRTRVSCAFLARQPARPFERPSFPSHALLHLLLLLLLSKQFGPIDFSRPPPKALYESDSAAFLIIVDGQKENAALEALGAYETATGPSRPSLSLSSFLSSSFSFHLIHLQSSQNPNRRVLNSLGAPFSSSSSSATNSDLISFFLYSCLLCDCLIWR